MSCISQREWSALAVKEYAVGDMIGIPRSHLDILHAYRCRDALYAGNGFYLNPMLHVRRGFSRKALLNARSGVRLTSRTTRDSIKSSRGKWTNQNGRNFWYFSVGPTTSNEFFHVQYHHGTYSQLNLCKTSLNSSKA